MEGSAEDTSETTAAGGEGLLRNHRRSGARRPPKVWIMAGQPEVAGFSDEREERKRRSERGRGEWVVWPCGSVNVREKWRERESYREREEGGSRERAQTQSLGRGIDGLGNSSPVVLSYSI